MAHSTHTIRIVVASVLALLMVGGAYAFSGPAPFFSTNIVGAQSSEELLREYAAKDTDADSLPDWQEALYGTDPRNPESFRAGVMDGDAVAQGLIQPKVIVADAPEPTDIDSIPGTVAAPSSLTDRFAQTLLKQYLLNRGETPPTPEEVAKFVQAGVADLAANTANQETYSLNDVQSSGDSGREALIRYAGRVERALAIHNIRPAKNELFYFSDAVKGDSSALGYITKIGAAYKASARELIKVPVPSEARRAHLALVNATMNTATIAEDLASLEEDPLRALMGLGLYERTAEKFVTSLAGVYALFNAAQATIPDGADGAEFLFVTREASKIRTD